MRIDGKTIQNAKKPVTIKVLATDIKKADPKRPDACAFAQAALRQAGCSRARIHISTSYLEFDGKWLRYRTPTSMRDEIISFDRAGVFNPGEYELRPIQPSHQAKGVRIGGKTTAKKPLPKKRKKHILTGVRHNADVR